MLFIVPFNLRLDILICSDYAFSGKNNLQFNSKICSSPDYSSLILTPLLSYNHNYLYSVLPYILKHTEHPLHFLLFFHIYHTHKLLAKEYSYYIILPFPFIMKIPCPIDIPSSPILFNPNAHSGISISSNKVSFICIKFCISIICI